MVRYRRVLAAELFALYAMYWTDSFFCVDGMSVSLWFPGMKEHIFSHEPQGWPDCMYFSLGDKERKTPNLVLRSVRQNTEEIQAFYKAGDRHGIPVDPWNHFV